jgi:hypothetical protein
VKVIFEFIKFSVEFIFLLLVAASMSQEEWQEELERER